MKFSKQEKNGLIIVILIFSFIFSFTQWGPGEQAILSVGIKNLIISIFIVGVSVLLHHIVQKYAASLKGCKAEQKIWWEGLVGSLLLTILTNGALMVFAGTGTFIEKTKKIIGKKQQHINLYDYGKIVMWGVYANVFFGATMLTLSWIFGFKGGLISKIFIFNLLYAFWNLLPFPPLDGSRMFFASRLLYVFCMGTYAAYVALILVWGVFSFIYAIIIGYIILGLFYYFIELNY